MKVLGIIPARMESKRFPGKPLAKLMGFPLIQYAWEYANRCETLKGNIVIATDSEEIRKVAEGFGAKVVMTSKNCSCGTGRVWEVSEQIHADLYINIQLDEIGLNSRDLDIFIKTAEIYELYKHNEVLTMITHFQYMSEYLNKNNVKVLHNDQKCINFFREPYLTIRNLEELEDLNISKHIGIYAYSRSFLIQYNKVLKPTYREVNESLEQLRILDNDLIIRSHSAVPTFSINTPEDLQILEKA